MNKRSVGLVILLVLIGLGYLVLFNARKIPPIEAMYVELPGTQPIFSFNDDLTFTEIKIIRPGVEPAEDELFLPTEDQIVWHLVPREPRDDGDAREPRPTKVLKYGQGVGRFGMRPAEGTPRRGVPLEPGVTYLFTATLAQGAGVVELEFTPKAQG